VLPIVKCVAHRQVLPIVSHSHRQVLPSERKRPTQCDPTTQRNERNPTQIDIPGIRGVCAPGLGLQRARICLIRISNAALARAVERPLTQRQPNATQRRLNARPNADPTRPNADPTRIHTYIALCFRFCVRCGVYYACIYIYIDIRHTVCTKAT
jgi:hypothetical protein